MKWIFGHVLIVISLLTVFHPCFSKQIHVIPSVDSALYYHGKSAGKIYIRAGTFTRESAAKHYQTMLKNKTHSSILIVHKRHYYIVVIPAHCITLQK